MLADLQAQAQAQVQTQERSWVGRAGGGASRAEAGNLEGKAEVGSLMLRADPTTSGHDLGGAESQRAGAGKGRACMGKEKFALQYRILFLLAYLTVNCCFTYFDN